MLGNMKIKNTTKCDCGRQFVITDIEKLERIYDEKFYSGVVKHYSRAKCPNCGKDVILLLKQAGQTYDVINVAEEEKMIVTSGIVQANKPTFNVETETTASSIEQSQKETETEIENKEDNETSNELICSVCKKECKSKSGLIAHMRTHEN